MRCCRRYSALISASGGVSSYFTSSSGPSFSTLALQREPSSIWTNATMGQVSSAVRVSLSSTLPDTAGRLFERRAGLFSREWSSTAVAFSFPGTLNSRFTDFMGPPSCPPACFPEAPQLNTPRAVRNPQRSLASILIRRLPSEPSDSIPGTGARRYPSRQEPPVSWRPKDDGSGLPGRRSARRWHGPSGRLRQWP